MHASLGVKENMFPRWTEGSQEQAPDNTEAKNKDETESTQLSQEPSEKDGMAQEAGNGPKQSPMSKQHVDNTPCHTDLTENSNITTNQSLLSGNYEKNFEFAIKRIFSLPFSTLKKRRRGQAPLLGPKQLKLVVTSIWVKLILGLHSQSYLIILREQVVREKERTEFFKSRPNPRVTTNKCVSQKY